MLEILLLLEILRLVCLYTFFHFFYKFSKAVKRANKWEKEYITIIDANVKEVYGERLELHKKAGGLFKVLREPKKKQEPANENQDTSKGFVFFPDSCRIQMEQLIFFHDWIIVFLLTILACTVSSLIIIGTSSLTDRTITDRQSTEIVWTILPLMILILIALPSLRLLYLVDETGSTYMTIKALGHQWYWHYDYASAPSFDSYIIKSDYRLLNTDNRLFAPLLDTVQILITSSDVLHSWTIPTLAVKADAVPGRVNKLTLSPKLAGVFFGQCREICGRNHRFMPIAFESFVFN